MIVERVCPVAVLAAMLAAPGGCKSAEPAGPAAAPHESATVLAQRLEAAHDIKSWQSRQAVAADISVWFGGQERVRGSMVYDYHKNRSRIDMDDGTRLVFDGAAAWVSPASAAVPMARFHLLTWPYFLAAPFKIRDPGSHLSTSGMMTLFDQDHPTAMLTFGEGVGDSPDDWYVIYQDPVTDRLEGMAYIVTYGGKSRQEAEKEPHFIHYEDYVVVDDVVLSPHWTFFMWSEDKGAVGDPIGEVTLTNLHFVEPEPGFFVRPMDSKEDPLP